MNVSYEIILTIINLNDNNTKTFTKDFDFEIDKTDDKLYNNYHSIENNVNMINLFKKEINRYCKQNFISTNEIDIDEFNINSKTDRVDVYFEPGDGDDPNQISLEPNILCYVYPKFDELKAPELKGKAYDDTTIIWSWEDDAQAHYLISEPVDISDEENQDKIIAQIPIGITDYVETNLKPDTEYTRRIVAYNTEQTSMPSPACTVFTAVAPIDISLEKYKISKNYDYTTDEADREIIEENLEAFHSGVGDYNDLKVYKQMDADFYQKFKAYIQLRGARSQREKRYDSVGFNYKICLEGMETVEEQKGEVTFDIDAFPIESISIKDYMYATQPVIICARMFCDVLLKKPTEYTIDVSCPIKEPKWISKVKSVPNQKLNKVEIPPKYKNPHIIITIDVTASLDNTVCNPDPQYNWLYDNGCGIIRTLEKFINLLNGIDDPNCTFSLVYFARRARIQYKNVSKNIIIDDFNNVIGIIKADLTNGRNNYFSDVGMIPGVGYSTTNWGAGLKNAKNCIVGGKENILLFFTDGGDNTADNDGGYPDTTNHTRVSGNQPYEDLYTGHVRDCMQGANYKESIALIYKYDEARSKGSYTDSDRLVYTYNNLHAGAMNITNNNENNVMSWDDSSSLSSKLQQFVNQVQNTQTTVYYLDPNGNQTTHPYWDPKAGVATDDATHEEFDGWKFDGWHDNGNNINFTTNYDIDDCKWARVVVPPLDEPPWSITVNESMTPVVYARNEQRAIIPPDSIIYDRNFDLNSGARMNKPTGLKVDSKNIQDLILDNVKHTSLWKSGYNTVVEAETQDELAQGQYIIRGLFIKDTYMYSDDDTVPDVNFTDDGLEDGYVGTFNVYADINKLNTMVLGDDVYLVSKDSYVYWSGYTDAIIYDGERIQSFELNASHAESYDHQTEVLISPSMNYNNYLYNRKNNTINYTGSRYDVKHVMDIVNIDKDIYLTGTSKLKQAGDWELFLPSRINPNITDVTKFVRGANNPYIEPLVRDVVAHNDEHYQSPILNYRFNYEDPDAYTSYYELLPDCDPKSEYRHIIFLHIYYARNIFIQDENKVSGTSTVYINSFGDSNIATRSSRYYLSPSRILGQTYFRDDYISDYVWFQAKPMYETRKYYDEKPNPGMDTFYGNVNGRYREDNKSGKKDLRVLSPQFNIPTTVNANDIKIYAMITEFYPDSALVSYKWDHPLNGKDEITKVNGDYITFSSDSLTYKDVVYNELLQTVTSQNMELFNNKTTLEHFELTKPLTTHEYDHYYIELFSNNADVLALNYPSEIIFDENDKCEFGANFKGVINATTKWCPRIHNGYYYLNQHEYYAYSEFDVEADFEEYNEENYKNVHGYIAIDVSLLHKAGPKEFYTIIKNTRSELIQNEKKFKWIDGKGLTILPSVDGEYYKEYESVEYVSPVLLFKNQLTSAGRLTVSYTLEDGSEIENMKIRSYNIEQGKWSDWVDFSNSQIPPCDLSCAYQIKFLLDASVINHDKNIEDYLCCYLDWKDDQEEDALTNCVTITDHLQAGPYESDGIFISRIIDLGVQSTISLEMFSSKFEKECELYVSVENDRDKLLLEHANWVRITGKSRVSARYYRYKIVIPYGEKVYWIHKEITTKESDVMLPYITGIYMTGEYEPVDIEDQFQEIQSFEIITDGMSHRIFPSLYSIISEDVRMKGFVPSEIKTVRVSSVTENISINYNTYVNNDYPSMQELNTPVYATADFETEISSTNTPYIFAEYDPAKELDVIKIIKGTPQQYSPITVEDIDSIPYKEIYNVDPISLINKETFTISTEDDRHYIKLARNDYDIDTLNVFLNEQPFDGFNITNNLVVFNDLLNINDVIEFQYNIMYSFYAEVDYDNNKTQITVYSEHDKEIAKREKISNLAPITEGGLYTVCKLDQIYSNGKKILMNGELISPDNKWKYNANDKAIYYSDNEDSFSIIIDNVLPVTFYEMSIIAYSEDNDDDIIGFVIGYIKDSGGNVHTLTYLVSLGSDYKFNGDNTAIVYNYGLNNSEIIASKTVEHENFRTWKDIVNGIKFNVKKTDAKVQCKISNFNDPETINDESLLEIEFDTDTLQLFKKDVHYGFCVRSQDKTYFVNPEIAATINREITVEEQAEKLKNKYKVYFETNESNNKFIANNLSLNPIYRTDYKGFIYLTDEHNEPYKINIYCNPLYIKAGGFDKIDIVIECLDYQNNPVINKSIDIDCNYGILNFDNDRVKHLTDINGVIHVLYESAVDPCEDIVLARAIASDGTVIESSITIINE